MSIFNLPTGHINQFENPFTMENKNVRWDLAGDAANALKSGIASVGYGLGLGGFGVTEKAGTPYNVNQTPFSVYNATNAYQKPLPGNYNPTINGNNSPLGTSPLNKSVLGANAAPKGGNTTNTNLTDQQKWAQAGHSGQAPVGYHGESGGPSSSNGVSNSDVDAAWQPYLDALSGMSNDLQNQKSASLGNVDLQGTGLYNALPGEEQAQRDTINENALQLGHQTQSAYDKSVRDYNALRQQSQALYGGQNSAGLALNDLAQQSYLQNNGLIQDQDATGNQKLGDWNQQVTNWVQDKHSKIDSWLADAKLQVNNLFTTGMQQINNSKAMAENQKATAKMDLLQNVADLNNKLAASNAAFKQQVALYAAQTAAPISSNTAYDSTNQAAALNNVYSTIGQTANAAPAWGNTLSQAGAKNPLPQMTAVTPPKNNQQDALSQVLAILTGGGQGTTQNLQNSQLGTGLGTQATA